MLKKIWELIMKACRFILNTDYVTHQNDNEYTISVVIPSTFTVPAYSVQKFESSINIANSATKDYRCYIESTAFNYAITGVLCALLGYGSDELAIALERNGTKYTLRVWAAADSTAKTFSGTGQVITAHIQTFVDPFQV